MTAIAANISLSLHLKNSTVELPDGSMCTLHDYQIITNTGHICHWNLNGKLTKYLFIENLLGELLAEIL